MRQAQAPIDGRSLVIVVTLAFLYANWKASLLIFFTISFIRIDEVRAVSPFPVVNVRDERISALRNGHVGFVWSPIHVFKVIH